jgi:hypothetical protein
VIDRLPKPLHTPVRRALRQAWELDDAEKVERLLRNLARRLAVPIMFCPRSRVLARIAHDGESGGFGREHDAVADSPNHPRSRGVGVETVKAALQRGIRCCAGAVSAESSCGSV